MHIPANDAAKGELWLWSDRVGALYPFLLRPQPVDGTSVWWFDKDGSLKPSSWVPAKVRAEGRPFRTFDDLRPAERLYFYSPMHMGLASSHINPWADLEVGPDADLEDSVVTPCA